MLARTSLVALALSILLTSITVAEDEGEAEDMQTVPGLVTGVETQIDLTHWKVTLPVNAQGQLTGQGDAVEIKDLSGVSIPPYYDVHPDWITFMAPTDGAHTSGSHYPRAELREMDGQGNEYEWLAADGGQLSATLRVDELPTVTGKMQSRVIVGQIHGPNDELCRLYYDTLGNLYFIDDKAGAKQTETPFQLKAADGTKPKIPLGETFSYSITVAGGKLTVTVVHKGIEYSATDTLSAFWPGKPLYFKAGAYVQVGPIGSGAMNQGQGRGSVTFFDISRPTHDVYHTTDVAEDTTDSGDNGDKSPEEGASDAQIYAGCVVVMTTELLKTDSDYAHAKAAAKPLCEDVNEDFESGEMAQIDKIVDAILRPTKR